MWYCVIVVCFYPSIGGIESPSIMSSAAANRLHFDYYSCSNLVMAYCALIFNLLCDTTQTTTGGNFLTISLEI